MMFEILVTAALRTLLLSLIVALCLRALRVRHAQLLLAVWTAVLVASLAMPMLQRHMTIVAPLPVDLPASFSGRSALKIPMTRRAETAAPTVSATPAVAAATIHNPIDWRGWIGQVYFAVAGMMLLRLMLGLALSWRLVHRSRQIRDDWAADGWVRTSEDIFAPVTVYNTVLLPADSAVWTVETRKAVIAHEMCHVLGGDFYVLALAQLNRAIFWFNPMSWWLHRRLASLAELASDDAAIGALGDGPSYAAVLLEVARRSGRAVVGVAMARPATIRYRIERILAQERTPAQVTALRRAIFAFGVAPLAVGAAISIADAAPPNKAAVDEQRQPHTAIIIDSKLLDAYAGYYRNQKTGSLMVVTRDGDHLMTRRANEAPVAEYPYTDHDFFLTVLPKQNSFVTDASGAAIRVIHHQMGRTETLERVSAEEGQRELAAVDKRLADENAPRVEIGIDPKLIDGYVGAYQLTPRMIFSVTRNGDKLFAQLTGQRNFQLHPYTDRDFFYTIVAAQLSFVPGADGTASAVILHQNGMDQTAERVDPALAQAMDRRLEEQRKPRTAVSIDPQLISRYVGRYMNDEAEITATREDNQLFMQVTGFGRYPVYPYTDKDFFATIKPIQMSFLSDGKGKATQLIRHQFGIDAVLNRVD
jgi:beta-lactamase regulating signal transducer with metallopeptidase domain